ncbi:MAG TPA: hypothetical protein VFK57_10010 [Vicinamibacterales bacterium]|nr:hypothetical protein [Vicinamibacterales bacterium]
MLVRSRLRRRSLGVVLLVLLSTETASAQQTAAKPAAAPKKNPLAKLVEPWPTPEKMAERKREAESDPLFVSDEPLEVTLVADFKAINRDRNPESKTAFPGTLRMGDASIPATINARGHLRRMARTCDYVPLRVAFEKKDVKGTLFARQDAVKLVVQCAGGRDYEQYILREHLAYRVFNVITPNSFRARLARITYVDAATGKGLGTRSGMFLEDESSVARRMEGRVVELPRLRFDDLSTDTLMPMMIFQYMIGNTDYSIYALHNVRIVQRPDKSLHPVPYDFDVSGLVNPPYGIPARALMIKSVTERMYRGPCRPQSIVDPYVANFVAKKDIVRALPDSIPGFERGVRDTVRSFIDSFYSSIKSPKDVRGLFVNCSPKSTM